MTARDKAALVALRDAVVAGVKYETMGHTKMCQRAFPEPPDFDGSREAYAKSNAQMAILAWRNGSLDAALALHDAVLPNWTWAVSTYHEQEAMATIYYKSHNPSRQAFDYDPARAWLIAILNALIAQAGEDTQ